MELDITYKARQYHVEVSRFDYTPDIFTEGCAHDAEIDFVLCHADSRRTALHENDDLYFDDDLRNLIINECLKMQME